MMAPPIIYARADDVVDYWPGPPHVRNCRSDPSFQGCCECNSCRSKNIKSDDPGGADQDNSRDLIHRCQCVLGLIGGCICPAVKLARFGRGSQYLKSFVVRLAVEVFLKKLLEYRVLRHVREQSYRRVQLQIIG
jgi:hypothetical protein